jgi:hypothetical protein
VDTLASGPAVAIPHIKAGKLRPLAGWGAKRVASLPDVPTFKELGYDIEFYIWAGLFAPRGTSVEVMKRIRKSVKQAVNAAEFKSAMEKLQTPIAYLDAPEFQKFWDKDAKMLADALKRVGRVEIPAPLSKLLWRKTSRGCARCPSKIKSIRNSCASSNRAASFALCSPRNRVSHLRSLPASKAVSQSTNLVS